MKQYSALFAFMIISGLLLFSPISSYSANTSLSEEELKIIELIGECKEMVEKDEVKTEVEKRVAKDNCETEIRNENSDMDNDHKKQAELKVKLENVEKCVDWYPQFTVLSEDKFSLYKPMILVNDCLKLYNDPVWKYSGSDRLIVLVEKLEELNNEKVPEPEIEEPIQVVSTLPETPTLDSGIISSTNSLDKVAELEKRIEHLENELDKKNAVINEQLKVILDLADRIRNVIFSEISSILFNF